MSFHKQDHASSGARRFGRNVLHAHMHGKFADHAPGLHKWWKAHEKINGQVIEHISPYQQKVVSTLFKHPLQSIKSKAMGIWPAFPVFGGMFYFMHWAKETHHHNARAEWP